MPTKPKLSYLPGFEGSDRLYQRLVHEKGEIRLLIILPNTDPLAPLEATLCTVSIFDRPCYDAISYYWGSTAELQHISVCSSESERTPVYEIPVTQTLSSALRQYRSKANQLNDPSEALVVWTDALCINQSDVQERNEQVSVMHTIFRHAQTVWIWLGDDSDAAERGLLSLARLCKSFGYPEACELVAVSADEFTPTWHKANQDERSADGEEEPMYLSAEISKDVATLFDLPYWRRGWVFQEVCHMNYIMLNCGNVTCSVGYWVELKNASMELAETIESHGLLSGQDVDIRSRLLWDLRYALLPCLVALEAFNVGISSHTISEVATMIMSKTWQTSDPRDSVFVLTNIFRPLRGFQPDYRFSVEETFERAMIHILRAETQDFAALECWSSPSASPYLPSWVLDFASGYIGPHNATYSSTRCDYFINYFKRFDASAGAPISVRWPKAKTVKVVAITVDEIKLISPWLSHSIPYAELPWSVWNWWKEYALNHFVTHAENINGPGRDNPEKLATDRSQHLDDVVSRFIRTISLNSGPKDRRLRSEDYQILLNVLQHGSQGYSSVDSEALRLWIRCLGELVHQKRFIITDNDRMGLAHPDAATGDRVVIFASGNMPFIIRPVVSEGEADAHIIIGSCYLEGVMHGEAVEARFQHVMEEERLRRQDVRQLRHTRSWDSGREEIGTIGVDVIPLSMKCQQLRKTSSLDSGLQSQKSIKRFMSEQVFQDKICLV